MAAEIEGVIERSGYKLKRLTQAVRDRDAEIRALKSLLEETKRAADKRIESLETNVRYLRSRVPKIKRKPRTKPVAETTAQAQEVRESAA